MERSRDSLGLPVTYDPVCLTVTVSGATANEAVRVLVVSEAVRMTTS